MRRKVASPDPGPDRMAGITSMTPLETVPTTARYSDNSRSEPNRLLDAALADFDPALARGVRDVARKGRS